MRKKLSNLGEKYLEEIQRVKKANIWNRKGKFTQIKLVDLQQIIATFTKKKSRNFIVSLVKVELERNSHISRFQSFIVNTTAYTVCIWHTQMLFDPKHPGVHLRVYK